MNSVFEVLRSPANRRTAMLINGEVLAGNDHVNIFVEAKNIQVFSADLCGTQFIAGVGVGRHDFAREQDFHTLPGRSSRQWSCNCLQDNRRVLHAIHFGGQPSSNVGTRVRTIRWFQGERADFRSNW